MEAASTLDAILSSGSRAERPGMPPTTGCDHRRDASISATDRIALDTLGRSAIDRVQAIEIPLDAPTGSA